MIRNLQLSRTRVALLAAALALIASLTARGDRSLMTDGVHMIPMTLSEGAAVNDQGALLFSDDDAREIGLIPLTALGVSALALPTLLARRRSRAR